MSDIAETVLTAPETAMAGVPRSAESEHVLVIEPARGWSAINVGEIWHYRDLLLALVERDIKVRYKQTALGVSWVILQPLAAAGIFSFVFGIVAGLKGDGVPYFVFSFAGLLGWNLFSNTLTRASNCLVGSSSLISKVFFPRLILPLSTMGGVLVDFTVAAAMMVVLMFIYKIVPGWGIATLPLWLLMLGMVSLGLGMWSAALAVSYRDVQYIVPVATQLLLYATPVAYSAADMPAKWRAVVYANPLAGMVIGLRWSIIGSAPPSAVAVAWSAVAAVVVFVVGAFMFKKMERKFADVI